MLKQRQPRQFRSAVIAVIVLLVAAVAARSDETPQAEPELPYLDTDCATDVKQHCSTVGNGTGAVFTCLGFWRKQGQLTPECVTYFEGVVAERKKAQAERWANFREACSEEIGQYCAQYEQQTLALVGCLDQHSDALSETCEARRLRRHRYEGDGHIRWRDGSETEEFNREIAERQSKRRERLQNRRYGAEGPQLAEERQQKAEEMLRAHRERMQERAAARAAAGEGTEESAAPDAESAAQQAEAPDAAPREQGAATDRGDAAPQ